MTTSTQSTTITIDGMSCGHCVNAVKAALTAVPGITSHEVAIGSATIAPAAAADMALGAIDAAGFTARRADGPRPEASGCSCCGGH